MRWSSATLVIMCAALLAGCSGTPAAMAPQPSPTPAATAPAAATTAATATPEIEAALAEELGPRVELPSGLLLKQIGKTAMSTGGTPPDPADWRVKVKVTGVRVDPKCERPGPPPSRGHRVVVSMEVETSKAYDTTSDAQVRWSQWSTIGADGVSEGGLSTLYECNQTKELTDDLRPASKYRGEVTLDSANTSGQVVWDDGFAWNYSA